MRNMLWQLLLVCAFAGFAMAATGSGLTGPVVVAKVALKNRNVNIPTTTLFTPKNDGLFRISAYAIPTVVDASGNDQFFVNFEYTDDVGPETQLFPVLAGMPGCNQQNSGAVYNCDFTVTVEAVAGNPLSYSVQLCTGCSITYSLYVTVERLE